MIGRRVSPSLTVNDAQSYIIAVKEAFDDEPSKYEEFIKLLHGVRDHRYGFFSSCYIWFGLMFSTVNLHNKTLCELILMLLVSFVVSIKILSLQGLRNS